MKLKYVGLAVFLVIAEPLLLYGSTLCTDAVERKRLFL